jgi:hypothetical protein
MKIQKLAVAVIFGFVLGINVASAQSILANGYFTFDENGTGYFQATPTSSEVPLPYFVEPDPTGRSSVPVLVYQLPFPSASPGDLQVTEPEGGIGDVITFYNAPTGGGYLIFYSLDTTYQGPDWGLAGMGTAWADITAPDFNNVLQNPWNPTGQFPPQQLNEYINMNSQFPQATGGVAWFIYTDRANYTYLFYSDIPEPSTFGLLALGALGLLWRKRS